VVTTQDEGQVNLVGGVPTLQRRKTQIIHDALGREKKRLIYNWDGTVYASTTTAYNTRDQVISVKQYKGDGDGVSCPTETCQEATMSYDGHGRLAARRLPQEDGNTTYTYFANDLLQSSTDARGANGTFIYNDRGLMTDANYAGGSGVATTPNVSFDYDELGNLLWMDDGPGRVDYNYNTLGRLMSESRQFDAIPGMTFQLSYDYNLAGGLKQVTDPRGDVIHYGHDSGGRLTSVTGSSFAGVTNYATGFQYRAWGQPKYLDYGDSFHADIGYNARMSVNSFNIPGVLGANYTLNEDGRIRSVDSLIDSRLNRGFSWDHMGRIIGSGAGAPGNPNQFSQSYEYDEYGHTTSRSGWYWLSFTNTMSATYSRERAVSSTERDHGPNPPTFNRSFQYDAMGNTTGVTTEVVPWVGQPSTSTETRVYDAVGRQNISGRELDGFGRVVKEGGAYNLISTPLGGQVLTVLNGSGQKTKGGVYVGTDVLAEQIMLSGQPSEVIWRHRDPMNTASRDAKSGGWTGQLYMVDPLGTMQPPATSSEIQAQQTSLICSRATPPPPGCEGQPSAASFYTPDPNTYKGSGAAGQFASGCTAFSSASVSCGPQLDFFNNMSPRMLEGYEKYAEMVLEARLNENRKKWGNPEATLTTAQRIALESSFAGVTAAAVGGTYTLKPEYKVFEYEPGHTIKKLVGFNRVLVPGGEPEPQRRTTPTVDSRTNEQKRNAALNIAFGVLYNSPECNDLISGRSGIASALLSGLSDRGQFTEQDDVVFHDPRIAHVPAFTTGQGDLAEIKLRVAVRDPAFDSTGFFERERYGIPGIPGGLDADTQRAFIFIHELSHATGRFTHPGQGDPRDFDEPPIENEMLNKLIFETCFSFKK
jgi:YD repeat-containing protein